MSDTVLVLGATGKTGRRLVPRLRVRGVAVRAASRSSATPFDWSDPAGWEEALRGVDAVYIVAPPVPTLPGPVHELVARAEAVGVRRLVLLSGHGLDQYADSEFGADMRSAEDAVRTSALEWTVLRASNFDQNFDEELFHGPLLDGELALPSGEVPEAFLDLEDLADVAATVLTEPGRHAGRVYELTGPRALTFAEAVALIARATGLPLTYRQVPPGDYTEALRRQGVDGDTARSLTAMYEVMERGVIADTSEDVAAVLGRPPRTFEDYVVRSAAAGAWQR